MSLPTFTLGDARARVDFHLRDRDSASESFSLFEKNVAIESAMRLMAPKLLLGDSWSLPLFAVVAGTDTYVLPSTTAQQYDRLKMLRLRSTGQEIPVVSFVEFERFRAGDTVPSSSTPLVAMIYEGESGAPSVRLWPRPSAADNMDGFFTRLPAALGQDDGATIPFDELAFEALCYAAALELYGKLTEDERARRKLGPDTAALWGSHVASGIRDSRHRKRRQQGGSTTSRRRSW